MVIVVFIERCLGVHPYFLSVLQEGYIEQIVDNLLLFACGSDNLRAGLQAPDALIGFQQLAEFWRIKGEAFHFIGGLALAQIVQIGDH